MPVTMLPWCLLLGLLPLVTAFSLNVAVLELHPAGNSLQQVPSAGLGGMGNKVLALVLVPWSRTRY